MARSAGEATVADLGYSGNQMCVRGSFLRIPYDVEIWVGDEMVASDTLIVQADDTETHTLHLDSSSQPPMDAFLSEAREEAARDETDPSWTSWDWTVSHSGPFETPNLSIGVDFESTDSNGRGILWRSELVQP